MRFDLPSLRLADQEMLRLTYRMRVSVGALQERRRQPRPAPPAARCARMKRRPA